MDVAKADESLILFLKRARRKNPSIIQAGVWAMTDNYSAHDIAPALATTVTSSVESRRQDSYLAQTNSCGQAHLG
jgi:hypothetical protein